MSWRDSLQQASWRGVVFQVDGTSVRAGRHTAVHRYPFRETDVVWVEDLGLAPRRVQFLGFLVGDDVAAQQDRMIAAVEEKGPGELVHPLLGSMTGVVVEFSSSVRKDRGRAVEMSFDFIVQDGAASPYPAVTVDKAAVVKDSAAAARTATVADTGSALFGSTTLGQAASVVGQGIRQVQGAIREVQSVASQALSIGRSAASLVGAAGVLPGNLGRFLGGASGLSGGLGGISSAFRGLTTISSALSTATRLGAGVTSTVGNLQRLIGRL